MIFNLHYQPNEVVIEFGLEVLSFFVWVDLSGCSGFLSVLQSMMRTSHYHDFSVIISKIITIFRLRLQILLFTPLWFSPFLFLRVNCLILLDSVSAHGIWCPDFNSLCSWTFRFSGQKENTWTGLATPLAPYILANSYFIPDHILYPSDMAFSHGHA